MPTRVHHCGCVAFATHENMCRLITNTHGIAAWAPNLVSVCLMENSVDPQEVGSMRRCVIAGGAANRVMRETKTYDWRSATKTVVTYRTSDSIRHEKAAQSQTLAQASAAMLDTADQQAKQGLNGGEGGNYKSTISNDPGVAAALPVVCDFVPATDITSTISLSENSYDKGKCFLEFSTTFSANSDEQLDLVEEFLEKEWVRPQVDALCEYALNVSFPLRNKSKQQHLEAKFEEHEDAFVRLAAVRNVDPMIVAGIEKMLDALKLAYNDLSTASLQSDHLKEELNSCNLIITEANSKIAQLQREVDEMQLKVLFKNHGVNNNPTAEEEAVHRDDDQADGVQQNTAGQDDNVTQQHQQQGGGGSYPDTNSMQQQHQHQHVVPLGAEAAARAVPPFGQVQSAHHQPDHPTTTTSLYGATDRSDAAMRQQFDALDVDGNGRLTIDQIAGLLAKYDVRSDFDVEETLGMKHATPRRQKALKDVSLAAPRSRREELHQKEAVEWVLRYGKDPKTLTVGFPEFTLLMCQLQRNT